MLPISTLTDKIVTIPDPTVPLALSYSYSGVVWNNSGQVTPTKGGTYSVANMLVDIRNRTGTYSWYTTVIVKDGWILFGSNSNLPEHPFRAGVAWRMTYQGRWVWLVEQQGNSYAPLSASLSPMETKAPYPWSSNNPLLYPLAIHDRGNASLPILNSELLDGVYLPPSVTVASHEIGMVDVAWQWVGNAGLSKLSPATTLPPSHPGLVGYRILKLENCPLPMGVLGRYIYLRLNGKWRRQRNIYTKSYLFGPQDQQPILWEDHEGPEYVEPIEPCRSWVSPIQQAMFSRESAIIIDAPAYCYGPVIDPWLPGVVGRTVSAPGLSGWTLEQRVNLP